jgi:hypothetical protein
MMFVSITALTRWLAAIMGWPDEPVEDAMRAPDEVDEVMLAGKMTPEQVNIANDLTENTLRRIGMSIHDHIQISDHPAQTYVMLIQAMKMVAAGFAMYHPVAGIDKHGQIPAANHKLDRIRYSMAVVFLMLADDDGNKEARQVLKKAIANNVDGRELMRFISTLKFPPPRRS